MSASKKTDTNPMPANKTIVDVAIDDGLAQIKLYAHDAGGPKSWRCHTAVHPASAGATIDLSGELVGMYETSEGQRFVCSADTANTEEMRFPDFHISQQDRVLIHNALVEAGYGGCDVRVLTSLPVDEYFVAGQINKDRIEKKRANLLKGVTPVPEGSREMARIVDVKVGCQAIAAFFDAMFDDDGKPLARPPESAAIIDIGGSTTDIAVILGGSRIDGGSSGAIRIGVLDVHTGVRNNLTRELGFDFKTSPAAMDRALRSRNIMLWGKPRDISAAIDKAVTDVAEQIRREIDRKIGNGATLEKIIFVGGGAALFGDIVGHWPNAQVPAEAEYSNARGLLKYARRSGG